MRQKDDLATTPFVCESQTLFRLVQCKAMGHRRFEGQPTDREKSRQVPTPAKGKDDGTNQRYRLAVDVARIDYLFRAADSHDGCLSFASQAGDDALSRCGGTRSLDHVFNTLDVRRAIDMVEFRGGFRGADFRRIDRRIRAAQERKLQSFRDDIDPRGRAIPSPCP